MEDRDTDEFILVLRGYFKLLMALNLPVDREGDSLHADSGKRNNKRLGTVRSDGRLFVGGGRFFENGVLTAFRFLAPQYYSHHVVKPSLWSYGPSTMYAKEQEKLTNFAFCPTYTPFKHEMVSDFKHPRGI